jgi:DNA-binding PadR family transcriptional regulator
MGGGGKRPRLRRGVLQYAILAILSEGEKHGYALICAFRARGWNVPSPGSIYPLLATLRTRGELVSHNEDGRRVYGITERGRATLYEHVDRLSELETMRDSNEEHDDLHEAAERLMQAVSLVQVAKTSPIVRKVRKIIDDARREIYAVLSSE